MDAFRGCLEANTCVIRLRIRTPLRNALQGSSQLAVFSGTYRRVARPSMATPLDAGDDLAMRAHRVSARHPSASDYRMPALGGNFVTRGTFRVRSINGAMGYANSFNSSTVYSISSNQEER